MPLCASLPKVAAAIAIGLALLGIAPAASAAIELSVTAKHELIVAPDADGKARVRYPIHAPAADRPSAVVIASVQKGMLAAAAVEKQLAAQLSVNAATHEQEIELTLDLGRPVPQGSYDVRLSFSFADPKAEPAFATVQLVLLAAHVQVPAKQILEQVDGSLEGAPMLHLLETTGLSRVSIADISGMGSFRQDDKEIDPPIAFGPAGSAGPIAPIAPGKPVSIPVRLAAELPLGTWTGTVRITAPELEAPVDVTYEIRARRSHAWIFFAAIAGLLAGFLVREVLSKLAGLGDARRKADEMLVRLDGERKSRADRDFLKAADAAVDTLAQVRKTAKDAGALTAAIEAANTALSVALAELKERKDRATAAYNELRDLLRARYHLPPKLRERLAAASAPLAAAAARLNADDADPDPLAALAADLLDAAKTLGDEWKSRVLHLLGRLPPLDGLVKDPSGGITIDALRTALLEDPKPGATAKAVLDALSQKHEKLDALERRLLLEIHGVAESLAALAPADSPQVAALRAEVASLQAQHDQHPDEPEEILQAVSARTAALIEAASMPMVGSNREALSGLLRKGEYRQAIEMVEASMRAPSRPEGAPMSFGLDEDEPMEAPPGKPKAAHAAAEMTEASARSIAAAGDAVGGSRGAAPFMLDSAAGLSLAARALTAAFVGGIVGLVAVAVYEKTFIGTGADLLAVFGWTWGLNVTSLDAATSALSKVKSKDEK
jgi:hypothetical protein